MALYMALGALYGLIDLHSPLYLPGGLKCGAYPVPISDKETNEKLPYGLFHYLRELDGLKATRARKN